MDWKYRPFHLTLYVLLALVFVPSSFGGPTYSISLESALRAELFTTNNYEVLQRPEQKVVVRISITILTINDLNIKDQALSISGYLTFTWGDPRLDWSDPTNTTQDYGNVDFLFSTEEYVWRPSIIIENSIQDMGVISDKSTPMRITNRGKIVWSPSSIFVVSCESDTTYYPLDTQDCKLKVSSKAYTINEVSLTLVLDPVILDFYSENGEWDLVSASGLEVRDTPIGQASFSSVDFDIKLRRRPIFHIINTLFPVVLMAILIAMVFKLPVDSGERNGFALTVLLAYAVYLSIISENIPSTSVSVCYLSLYLAFVLFLAAMSVVLTIFVLRAHYATGEIHKVYKILFKCVSRSKVDVEILEKTDVGEYQHEDSKLTWQIVAEGMDTVFFFVYVVLISVVTSVLTVAYIIHYHST
ncbi:acetylcholine receptor subunit delta-like [Mytilus trossulus]|uniref:acetylcholine receptor subunit delta-like n=1 Tax=Mytilus trossulus TaxID=6551 RepID=UPI003005D21A